MKGFFHHAIDGVMINRLTGKARKGFIQGIDSRPLLYQRQSTRCESGLEEEATNFVLSGCMWKCLRIVAGKAEEEPETVRGQNIKTFQCEEKRQCSSCKRDLLLRRGQVSGTRVWGTGHSLCWIHRGVSSRKCRAGYALRLQDKPSCWLKSYLRRPCI